MHFSRSAGRKCRDSTVRNFKLTKSKIPNYSHLKHDALSVMTISDTPCVTNKLLNFDIVVPEFAELGMGITSSHFVYEKISFP